MLLYFPLLSIHKTSAAAAGLHQSPLCISPFAYPNAIYLSPGVLLRAAAQLETLIFHKAGHFLAVSGFYQGEMLANILLRQEVVSGDTVASIFRRAIPKATGKRKSPINTKVSFCSCPRQAAAFFQAVSKQNILCVCNGVGQGVLFKLPVTSEFRKHRA